MNNPQKQYLWKLIEQYRQSGGREEHWRNRDVLDIEIDRLIDEVSIAAQAKRLALELECVLMSSPGANVSKWWDSGMEALQQYRDACALAYQEQAAQLMEHRE